MSDLIERLRIVPAIERLPERGLASEAADHIEALEAKLAVAREALEKVAACKASINGHIAREALRAMIAAATPHDDGGE